MSRLGLKINLESPLLSFGADAVYNDLHRTGYKPLKSQIIGMLGAAFGIRRSDKKKMEELNEKYDIVFPELKEYPKVYEDFQTVSKRVTLSGRLANGKITRAEGDRFPATGGGNVGGGGRPPLVRKQYLLNVSTTAYIVGKEEDLKEAEKALNEPYYPLYIGRKCCVPSAPIAGKIEEVK